MKLPAALRTGVRLTHLDEKGATASIKHRWINQNPYSSMFEAVQGMAAEFPTGILLTDQIRKSGRNISMLVLNNKANFSKKATGRINFTCDQGEEAKRAIDTLIATGESQLFGSMLRESIKHGQRYSPSLRMTLLLKD